MVVAVPAESAALVAAAAAVGASAVAAVAKIVGATTAPVVATGSVATFAAVGEAGAAAGLHAVRISPKAVKAPKTVNPMPTLTGLFHCRLDLPLITSNSSLLVELHIAQARIARGCRPVIQYS